MPFRFAYSLRRLPRDALLVVATAAGGTKCVDRVETAVDRRRLSRQTWISYCRLYSTEIYRIARWNVESPAGYSF